MKLSDFASSKKKGDVGLGVAISYFIRSGYTVSIPLTDSQEYDLIVDKDNLLQRVQVKTTAGKKDDIFIVQLRTRTTKGGKNYFKNFDNSLVEILFILTESGEEYLIPSKEIENKTAIKLISKYNTYKI